MCVSVFDQAFERYAAIKRRSFVLAEHSVPLRGAVKQPRPGVHYPAVSGSKTVTARPLPVASMLRPHRLIDLASPTPATVQCPRSHRPVPSSKQGDGQSLASLTSLIASDGRVHPLSVASSRRASVPSSICRAKCRHCRRARERQKLWSVRAPPPVYGRRDRPNHIGIGSCIQRRSTDCCRVSYSRARTRGKHSAHLFQRARS